MIPVSYMDTNEVSVAFGVHPQTVRRWYKKGGLPTYYKDAKTGEIKPSHPNRSGLPVLFRSHDVSLHFNKRYNKGVR